MRHLIIFIILILVILATAIFFFASPVKKSRCGEGYVFSQETCECMADPFICSNKIVGCDQNLACKLFARSGTCDCPECEIAITQCLPK
jgi:hypothetical protein